MNSTVVRTMNLTKEYEKGTTRALNGVTLEFNGQGVFTILGRNGAGKTTFLRILGTQLMPTSGEVYVLGYNVVKEAKMIRKAISVMPQEGATLPPLTPRDHIYYTLLIKGFKEDTAKRSTQEMLEKLELLKYKDVNADRLSGGLRQRTLVGMAMAAKARLLLLDEPTLGLDPLSRRNIWKIIREYCREQGSVILTTHYLEEAEILSDYVIIINNGKLLARGNVDELKSIIKEKIKVEVYNGFTNDELSSFGRLVMIADRKRVLTDEKSAEELVNVAIKKGVKVQTSPITLDDVFVEIADVGESD